MMPASHVNLKISVVLCSDLSFDVDTELNEVDNFDVPFTSNPKQPKTSPSDAVDIQVKQYSLKKNSIVFQVSYWIMDFTSPHLPSSHLLPQNCAGSAAVIFVVKPTTTEGEDVSYERLAEAEYTINNSSPNQIKPRMVAIMKGSSKNEFEAIKRLCTDRGIHVNNVANGTNILDDSFSKLLKILKIGERSSIFTDPAFLLGKRVEVSSQVYSDEDFLNVLFTAPS